MTMTFNNPAYRDTGKVWGGRPVIELVEDLIFTIHIGNGELKLVIPGRRGDIPGFKSDFASIPRLFWIFLPPTGPYNQPGIIHDFLYSSYADGISEDGEPEGSCSRAFADVIFREAMRAKGVSWWKRWTMYFALRAFGKFGWRKR